MEMDKRSKWMLMDQAKSKWITEWYLQQINLPKELQTQLFTNIHEVPRKELTMPFSIKRHT
jgi:hypothetical protein